MGRIIQIICGCVATLALCGFLWFYFQPNVPASANQRASGPDRNYQAGGAECQPQALRSIADSIAHQSKADDCARQHEEHRAQQADLVQQTRAANGSETVAALTKDQTRLALLTTIVSLVATALLVWTLWETRSTNRAQLRAYVMFDLERTDAIPKNGAVLVVFKNSGQTPARQVTCGVVIEINVEPPSLPAFASPSVYALAPGGIATVTAKTSPAPEQAAAFLAGAARLWVVGRITYIDVFGKRRSTELRASAGRNEQFTLEGTGNDFT